MKELVDYIAQFDPAFPASVRGASPQEIDRLERAADRPLPPVYRSFLQAIGHGLGTFQAFNGTRDFSVATLTERYEARQVNAPESFVMVAYDTSDMTSDIFLESLPGVREPQVVEFCCEVKPFDPAVNGYMIKFESMRQMLFGLAFHVVRLPALGHVTTLLVLGDVDQRPEARAARLKNFADLAAKLGFAPVAHTGGWFPCFGGDQAGLLCYQPPLLAPYYQIGAATEKELNRLAEVLCDGLGLIRPRE